jgi:hypothetical protein
MPVCGRVVLSRSSLLLGIVPAGVCLCLASGCGGGSSDKPAPVDAGQQQKVNEYFKNYKDQLIAEAKSRAKTKTSPKGAEKAP